MSAMVRRAFCDSSSMILWSVGSSSASLMSAQPNEAGPVSAFGASDRPTPDLRCVSVRSICLAVHRNGVGTVRSERFAVPGGPAVLELETTRPGQRIVGVDIESAAAQRIAGNGQPPADQQAGHIGH